MSQRHTFRCFGLTLTESRGYECMVIYLQCSLTLDRDYFAYLVIVTHPGPTTDGGGGGLRAIVIHPGAANWDGSWGGKAFFMPSHATPIDLPLVRAE